MRSPTYLYLNMIGSYKGLIIGLWRFFVIGIVLVLVLVAKLCYKILPPSRNVIAWKNVLHFRAEGVEVVAEQHEQDEAPECVCVVCVRERAQ